MIMTPSDETFNDMVTLHQYICFSLLDDSRLSDSCKSMLETVQEKLLHYLDVQNNNKVRKYTFRNNAEKRLFKVLSELFGHKQCRMLSNVYHLGFECNILIHGDDGGYVNVECDGAVHSAARKRKLYELRDAYLRRNKVLVLRVSVKDHLIGVSDEQLKQTILNMIRQSKDIVSDI